MTLTVWFVSNKSGMSYWLTPSPDSEVYVVQERNVNSFFFCFNYFQYTSTTTTTNITKKHMTVYEDAWEEMIHLTWISKTFPFPKKLATKHVRPHTENALDFGNAIHVAPRTIFIWNVVSFFFFFFFLTFLFFSFSLRFLLTRKSQVPPLLFVIAVLLPVLRSKEKWQLLRRKRKQLGNWAKVIYSIPFSFTSICTNSSYNLLLTVNLQTYLLLSSLFICFRIKNLQGFVPYLIHLIL